MEWMGALVCTCVCARTFVNDCMCVCASVRFVLFPGLFALGMFTETLFPMPFMMIELMSERPLRANSLLEM